MTKYRKGVFFIIYSRNKKGGAEYLILKRIKHWKGLEFPKGGLEEKESTLEAVHRELKEETGLTALKIRKFDVSGEYKFNKKLKDRPSLDGQTYEALFAIKVKKGQVKIDEVEHEDFKWMNFDLAFKKLTWPNQKNCLKIVDNWTKLKYREYLTSSGVQILIGKNKEQNEELVKKYMKKKNIIMHTAARGSPFCIINHPKPSKKDIQETAVACARYSQDWRNNKKDVKVHIFTGKYIYKNKDMPTGTFGVKKKKVVIVKKADIIKLK